MFLIVKENGLHVIETAIQLLINGDIVNYRYDSQRQEIAGK